MQNYISISKRTIQHELNIRKLKHKIEAITIALIGAVGKGLKTDLLSYDKEELNNIDLADYINVFEQSNKSIDELEKFLISLNNDLKLETTYYNLELGELIHHYKMCYKNFLNNYLLISGNNAVNLSKNKIIEKLKNENINLEVVYLDNNISIYYKDKEDLYKIKQFFSKNNISIEYKLFIFDLNENNKILLPYLYRG